MPIKAVFKFCAVSLPRLTANASAWYSSVLVIVLVTNDRNADKGVNKVEARKSEMTVGPGPPPVLVAPSTTPLDTIFETTEEDEGEEEEEVKPKEDRREAFDRKRTKIEREKAI